MSVLHQSMCTFNAGLSSSYDGWEKYKEKVFDVSDPNSKLMFTWIKNLSIEMVQKN